MYRYQELYCLRHSCKGIERTAIRQVEEIILSCSAYRAAESLLITTGCEPDDVSNVLE